MSETDIHTIYNKQPRSLKDMIYKALSGLRISNLKRRSWQTKLSILVVIAALVCGFLTYSALTETPPFGDDPDLVIWLLNIDLILLLILVSLIARRIVMVWSGKRRGIAGSHLHVRLVYIFSILVAVPTAIMTIFSASFFHFGVQAWFSQRVQTAINESQAVAESYLEEHKQVIRADTLAMANDIDRQANRLILDEASFSKMLDTQAFFRNLSEAIVIEEPNRRVLARSSLTLTLEYEKIPDIALSQAQEDEVVLMMNEDQSRVRALVRLGSFNNTYLYVGRMIDPQVLSHLSAAKVAVDDYTSLKNQYSGLQITVTLMFVVIAMLLLLAAIWSGLLLARQLVHPISELITAAERVRAGDLSSRLPETNQIDEFEYLARSFNRMTSQIQTQRNELINANKQIDRRRRLTETVLTGVSSGVLGVDNRGIVNLANTSASALLCADISDIVGKYILDVLPELDSILQDVADNPKKMMQSEIPVIFDKVGKRIFLFRISIEALEENEAGLIITFDDITELQSAQRKAAWSDVARRIAHEIKNPLTPIQLSAERLKRKYLKEIKTDPDTFSQCTDTIIKHVADIGKMVDEFSSFARMPEAVLKPANPEKHIKDCISLIKQAHPDITFNITSTTPEDTVQLDSRQIRQAMTNLLQNAVDSIHMAKQKHGEIDILINNHDTSLYVAITDNGSGFPKDEDVSNLTEPYITHKEKGTGLGLAIVKKVMEDHGGRLILGVPAYVEASKYWHYKGGATLVLEFPNNQPQQTKPLKRAS